MSLFAGLILVGYTLDSYLHKCCKQVEDMIFSINHTSFVKDGRLTDQLFIWENIPREEYDRESLRSFLKQKFNWVWVEKAESEKLKMWRA